MSKICCDHNSKYHTPVQIARNSIAGAKEDENKIIYSAQLAVRSDDNFYDLVNDWDKFIADGWIDPDQRKFDVIPGVYCFYDSAGDPLYVGETNRLYGRTFTDHLKGKTNTVAYELFLRFRYLKIYDLSVYDSAHRKLLEQMIIFEQRPLYNMMVLEMLINKNHFHNLLKRSLTRDDWSDVTEEQKNSFEQKFPRNLAKIKAWQERETKKRERQKLKLQMEKLKKLKKKEGRKKGSL